jgi:hypothetical protein
MPSPSGHLSINAVKDAFLLAAKCFTGKRAKLNGASSLQIVMGYSEGEVMGA